MTVLIVGAGIVGCAVAFELASRGMSVRVIDMRGEGQGATRASAGVLAPHIEGHAAPLLQLGVRSLELYDWFVARVRDATALPVEYERSGTLEVACSAEELAVLQAASERHRKAGVHHDLLDEAGVRRLEPGLGPGALGGLLMHEHGYVAVAGFTMALADAAAGNGVEFLRGMTVSEVTSGPRGVRVETDAGSFDADAAVVAAGSWSGALTADHAPVRPVRGQLLHLGLDTRAAGRVVWGSRCYMVPWHDGSMLVGATVEDVGFDERATAAGVRSLLNEACSLLPTLDGATLHEVRTGLRPATPDDLPIIGPSSRMEGVCYATGHYRNGVLLAPLTAQLVADLIEGHSEPSDLELVHPKRFGL